MPVLGEVKVAEANMALAVRSMDVVMEATAGAVEAVTAKEDEEVAVAEETVAGACW